MHQLVRRTRERDMRGLGASKLVFERRVLERRIEPLVDQRLVLRGNELGHPFPLGLPCGNSSLECWTQMTGTSCARARSTARATFFNDARRVPRVAHHAVLHVDDQRTAWLPSRTVAIVIASDSGRASVSGLHRPGGGLVGNGNSGMLLVFWKLAISHSLFSFVST
jgi:hypothetical protein